jgi:hypothetical protein
MRSSNLSLGDKYSIGLKADYVWLLSSALFNNTALYFTAQVALMEEFDGLMSAANEFLDCDWLVLKTPPQSNTIYI